MSEQLHLVDHPLIRHKVTLLRDESTPVSTFRSLVTELTMLMAYEALRDLNTEPVAVRTPLTEARGHRLSGKKLAVVAVLRAGLAMVDGITELVPSARVGHLGMYRDPDSHEPVRYYAKLPADLADREVIVVDPMLATGGSAVDALDQCRAAGASHLRLVCLIGAPEGVARVNAAHPEVPVWLAALDERLDEHAYIVPGLGDAGDRIYGTR